jgi:ABC-type glutathione transport system ATPase component
MSDVVLAVRDVVREFGGRRRLFRAPRPTIRAVDGVSIDVLRGRTLGIVGESGSGKSTLARMMVGLLPATAGDIELDGRPVAKLLSEDRRALYRRVQMVFQDPFGSLNPRKTVRQILEAPLKALQGMSHSDRRDRVRELMALVRLRAEFADRHPHEFSGGQCQRIGIARALAAGPELVILDEPVSALDVSVQAQILALLADLQSRLNLTYVFISHDLAVVETISSEVAVMQFGKIVERGSRSEIFANPRHEYTRLLLSSIPGMSALKPS